MLRPSNQKIEFVEKELLTQPPVLVEKAVAAQPVTRLAASNVALTQIPAPVVTVEPEKAHHEVTYTVGKGDSLLKIAMRFNTTVAQLQADNSLKGTFLKVGQEIKINPGQKAFPGSKGC